MNVRRQLRATWFLRALMLLLLLGAGLFCWWAGASGYWTLLWWVGGALVCGLVLGTVWVLALLFKLLLSGLAEPPRPRGVPLDAATYFARVNALLTVPALELEYPGAVLLATSDSKTGWHAYDTAAPRAAALVWAEIREQAAPKPPLALTHPVGAFKRKMRQRQERGFSGYYSGEMGAKAVYGLAPLAAGQTFPPLMYTPSGSSRQLTSRERWEIIQRLVSESDAAAFPPKTIIAWYDERLLAQGWQRAADRPRFSGYDEEQDWCADTYVLRVNVFTPGEAGTYMPGIESVGRYARVVEVRVRPDVSW